ncbi:MAG: sensor histidine kinase [Cellvibrionaceae bacterium]|nr:sensor histidine kinase [Cellvibrionaceae bacterium]
MSDALADEDLALDFSLVLASSVHDMKNSLGMLLNSLEEVIDYSPPEDAMQKQRFSVLQYEASRINSELIQLLTIYRLQHQNLPFHLDENYVIETFEDQLARNDVLFKTQGITLTLDCDADMPWFYDGELIGNVIHNVLINAARYAQSRIHLSASVENKWLVIHIEDDGGGFPEFMLNAEPLSGDSVERGSNSTQLGLFFAAKIASFHRQGQNVGRIALSNGGTFGGGVFSIYLP